MVSWGPLEFWCQSEHHWIENTSENSAIKMAESSRGISDVTSAAGLNDLVSGDEVVLVYFSFGAKSAANPYSLGDAFDPQFEEFAESGEVVPKLFRAKHSETTAQFFMDVDIDPVLGGSLVLWKRGAVLAKASVKDLNESSDVETEVVKWLAGKYPSQDGSAKPRPAKPSSPQPGPKTDVPGQTPGAMCGAPPAGPPPAGPPPRPRPGQPTTMTVGAALSGPPPGPKTVVPGQTAGAVCGAPPAGPPPADPPPRPRPGQPITMTVGAALSGPQHAELERIVPPTQKPVEKVQREPSPTADASDGQCVSKAAPEPPRKMDLPLADPLPADDLGERIAKLFASHSRNGAVSRETMKALLKFLLTKQGSRKVLGPAHVDRIVDKFIEESDSDSSVDASQFIHWVWSGAKSRK